MLKLVCYGTTDFCTHLYLMLLFEYLLFYCFAKTELCRNILCMEAYIVPYLSYYIPTETLYQTVVVVDLGPVVQSIVSLTSSLRGQLVKSFMTL